MTLTATLPQRALDTDSVTPLRVALLGCGTVGSEVARLIIGQADDLRARIGRPLELVGIAVRRAGRDRPGIDPSLFTTDADALVARDDIDLVIEVIGGIEPARSLILAALRHGASVVTANKALLATDGATLFAAAEQSASDLYFEAAVAGAIPIIRPLRESLVGDEITAVIGIVNGTTNFILDKMDTVGAGFAETLVQAQELGYAEADPTADVEGFDAAAKAAILASLAFHTRVTGADVYREGITEVTSTDIASAREIGCVVKLLAIAQLSPVQDDHSERTVSVRVHPAMIPRSHPLAGVGGAYNAVFVESTSAGRLMFYGPGAGGSPTASAVLGDLVTVARNRVRGAVGPGESSYAARPVAPIGTVSTRYHLSLAVDDVAGVLATIAAVFAEHDVSIQTVRQHERGVDAQLVIVTHRALDAALSATVRALRDLPVVREVTSVMRVEGGVTMPESGRATRRRPTRGVIARYREWLPVADTDAVITLGEGSTPLVEAEHLSDRLGCETWVKVEGANPTGSFKDRGMTVALTVAAGTGARAVVCASTGNTSASASAYAVKAGLLPIVLLPAGRIAKGKLAQALVHGAKVVQVEGNFDDCLELARKLSHDYPVTLVNSVNPVRIEGQKTAAFEIVDDLGDAPDLHVLPVGNAGNISAYWRGYVQYAQAGRATHTPRMWGFQAAGAAPLVLGHPVLEPDTVATAIRVGNPASGALALAARDESGGLIEAVTDEQILAAQSLLAAREGIFVEPASAAGVAGLLMLADSGALTPGQRVVVTVTGHGLKDIDTALAGRGPVHAEVVPADLLAIASVCGLID